MKAIITDSEKQLSINDILDFETENDISLPENLKQLYLKFNGGNIEKDESESYFFTMKYGKVKIEDNIKILQKLEQLIPNEYLPFGDTPVGHIITIYMSDDENRGKIFLFRHDDLEPILISESLEAYLGINNVEEI